jgi:hypothetical protein
VTGGGDGGTRRRFTIDRHCNVGETRRSPPRSWHVHSFRRVFCVVHSAENTSILSNVAVLSSVQSIRLDRFSSQILIICSSTTK